MNHLINLLACLLLLSFTTLWSEETPKQPEQPTSGPGSSDYQHKTILKNSYGEGDTQYWLFEPADPKPASAPVIVFMHGWSAMDPKGYAAWIEHLVKRGNIVIYPRYQAQMFSLPLGYTGNAITALKTALAELQNNPHVKPDLTRVAIVGHSFGGVIAANIAALAAKNNLPIFKAVMCVEPGSGGFGVYENYSLIPAKTLLLSISGAEDAVVHDIDAKRIFNQSTSIAKDDKDYIVLLSDKHGKPAQVANHFVPASAANASGAMRWFGLWKWFDGLTDAAFFNKNRNYALGGTTEQKFMGKWSDGQPVVEPKITKEP